MYLHREKQRKNASQGRYKCFYKQLWRTAFRKFANTETQLLRMLENFLGSINLADLELTAMNIFIQAHINHISLYFLVIHAFNQYTFEIQRAEIHVGDGKLHYVF